MRPSPPSSRSASETPSQPDASSHSIRHIAARWWKSSSGLPKGWRKLGTNQTWSQAVAARTKYAASRCPTCGGLKEPPISATSLI